MFPIKLSKCIGVLHKTKPILNETALCILYCSKFLSYLSYCADVWGNTYKSKLQTIFLKQKAIRIICRAKYHDHTAELFYDNSTFNVQSISQKITS